MSAGVASRGRQAGTQFERCQRCVAAIQHAPPICRSDPRHLITPPPPPPLPPRRMMGLFAATQASLVQSSADLWASMAKQFEEPTAAAEAE